ncbi:hypothetical protein EJ04DRAFT_210564 [Polyplosphaeria fusca]|uniref:Uncharacterized protein n=1 Tax=Polyplosphaeria fusca TaxID=682080 RepID=A0A9P4V8B4_9PLEO|nr:hypothetical protein EJ04DRAFT_210564 [Polyplosphaeria fusca]
MEEAEDVYRFQEVDSDNEKHGVMVEPGYQRVSNGKPFNPDELYFNDMDIRAWERRTAEVDPMAYGDDYSYQEDEGYYEDGGEVTMSQAEYDELLFQQVLNKIRLARVTGDADVQLTQEELDAYQARLVRSRAPAARPQARPRPVSAPLNSATNTALVTSSSSTSGQGSSSTRSKKSQQRTSLFAPRPKKDKPSGRKRTTSNVSNTTSSTNQAPGLMVPGPNGQLVFAPITAYPGRGARDPGARSTGSPSQPASRSASINSRQAPTPPRVTPPRDLPGAFPSGSPIRPSSSSSRQSSYDNLDWQANRGRSGSVQPNQPAKLVPFPALDYQHFTAEPYQYFTPGQPSSSTQQPSQPSLSQPQFARRVASGPAEGNYMTMPRRVPVPVQRAAGPMPHVQGSHSDPTLVHASSPMAEVSEEDGLGIMVDVIPQADDRSYKMQTVKSSIKEGSSSSSARDSERRRKSGKSRRKP